MRDPSPHPQPCLVLPEARVVLQSWLVLGPPWCLTLFLPFNIQSGIPCFPPALPHAHIWQTVTCFHAHNPTILCHFPQPDSFIAATRLVSHTRSNLLEFPPVQVGHQWGQASLSRQALQISVVNKLIFPCPRLLSGTSGHSTRTRLLMPTTTALVTVLCIGSCLLPVLAFIAPRVGFQQKSLNRTLPGSPLPGSHSCLSHHHALLTNTFSVTGKRCQSCLFSLLSPHLSLGYSPGFGLFTLNIEPCFHILFLFC